MRLLVVTQALLTSGNLYFLSLVVILDDNKCDNMGGGEIGFYSFLSPTGRGLLALLIYLLMYFLIYVFI